SGSNSTAFPTASVTVTAGFMTQTFSVPTGAVVSSTPLTVTASYNGLTATAPLTVNPVPPPPVSGLSLSPATVIGGSATSATVSLTSSNKAVVASTTFAIPAGSMSA